jgi:hypothetical protein
LLFCPVHVSPLAGGGARFEPLKTARQIADQCCLLERALLRLQAALAAEPDGFGD